MTIEVRRVVTGRGPSGESVVAHDGPPPQTLDQPGRGLTFYEIWATDGRLTEDPTEDAGARPVEHQPPRTGTRFRIVEFLPDAAHDREAVAADLTSLGAAHISVENVDPTFHRNDSVDYNIILSGEIFAKCEADEVLLRAGDVLIQRGTAHTWSNRSDAPCVYASIMVSAEPLNPVEQP